MKITVLGTGYVGLVTGTCLADLGHSVICADVDKNKIELLNQGTIPFYEPGLKELFEINMREERLKFSASLKESITFGELILIAVGTPQDKDGSADLSQVMSVAGEIAEYAKDHKLIVIKSTVPVGTCMKVKKEIQKLSPELKFDIVSNPEFLREGSAVRDFMLPDRIVVGTENEEARKIMQEVYRGILRTGKPMIFTDIHSSEIIKYAANAMLATRISFMNMLSVLCEKKGADITEVARGIGLDTRIGPRFLHAGIGYGGSCFPKDVRALINTLKENDAPAGILQQVDETNNLQRSRFIDLITSTFDVKGKTIAIWGLAFKPKTDDIREAPALDVIRALQLKGATIHAFDPVAEHNATKVLSNVKFFDKPYDALKGAHALVICTEWDQFRTLDLNLLKELMRQPLIFDGRNVFDTAIIAQEGIRYVSIGRKPVQ